MSRWAFLSFSKEEKNNISKASHLYKREFTFSVKVSLEVVYIPFGYIYIYIYEFLTFFFFTYLYKREMKFEQDNLFKILILHQVPYLLFRQTFAFDVFKCQ